MPVGVLGQHPPAAVVFVKQISDTISAVDAQTLATVLDRETAEGYRGVVVDSRRVLLVGRRPFSSRAI